MSRDHVKFYTDERGKWRWEFIAANGTILATSGRSYSLLTAAEAGCEVVAGRQLRNGDNVNEITMLYITGKSESIPVEYVKNGEPL